VIIIPSLFGSKMEAKLEKNSSQHFYCYKKADWYQIWMNYIDFLPISSNCFFENFTPNYKNGGYYNFPGVSTRLVDYGGLGV
jgi:lysophospholipase-3